jgi:hypothetical protein
MVLSNGSLLRLKDWFILHVHRSLCLLCRRIGIYLCDTVISGYLNVPMDIHLRMLFVHFLELCHNLAVYWNIVTADIT